MNWDQIKGQWMQIKGRAREHWGKLSDDDLEQIAGQRDKLIGKLREQYGYAQEKAESEADAFVESLKE